MNVSVVIPVFIKNEEQLTWLGECIRSCISQTDDVVVWDDGSDVSLHGLMDIFPDASFHLDNEHRGKSHSRNHAVSLARYEHVYPVDADDKLVDGILDVLTGEWNGVPLYGSLIELHPGNVTSVNRLVAFDCDEMQKHCISPVNVLHTRQQWKIVGGWDVRLNLYEDWHYNAKLFWFFGGRRIDALALYYRQHELQSTRLVADDDNHRALEKARRMIQTFIRRYPNMCCGKRVSGNFASEERIPMAQRLGFSGPITSRSQQMDSANLSLEMDADELSRDPRPGYVWARYYGGNGMGPHERRGMRSRGRYKVQYGGLYEVKEGDAVSSEAYRRGAPSCDFVTIDIKVQASALPIPLPTDEVQTQPVENRVPSVVHERTPVKKADTDEEEYPFGDVISMLESGLISVKKLRTYLDKHKLDAYEINELVLAEQKGRDRVSVTKLLEKYDIYTED